MSASSGVYIEVPVQQSPFYPAAPSPEGVGVGGGASLVQSNSITSKLPSSIAQAAYEQLGYGQLGQSTCLEFVDYLIACEQKGFIIKGYDTREGKFVTRPFDYDNRWSPARRKWLAEKLKRLEYWFEQQVDRPVTMITLTSYHEGTSIPGAWAELNKSRKKLLDLVAYYFDSPDYFWVVEPHKSGYVHYHLAVFAEVDNNTKDKHGKGIEDKFRDLWSRKYKTGNHTYGLDFSQKKDDSKINHLKHYLSKYLEKGFLLDKWTVGMLKFNAYLWDTGFRMYGASTHIREIMNIPVEKQNQIVWLETKMQAPETTPEGEEIEIEKVIWYRQYIPDWIDSDMWIWQGKLRETEPPPLYIHDWGRKASNRFECVVHDMHDYKSTRAARVAASTDWSD
jgi:hypothetical protein